MKRRVLHFAFAASLGLMMAFSACGGEEPHSTLDIQYTEDEGTLDVVPPTDTFEDSVRDEGQPDTVVEKHLYEIFLLHDLSAPQQVRVNTNFTILAKVIDYGVNSPAANVLVSAEITSINDAVTGNPATGDALFTTPNAMTDDVEGVAKIGFHSGTIEGVIYEVTVHLPDYPDVAPKTMRLRIFDIPCGCLRTSLSYEGEVEMLKDIEIYVLPEDYRCNELSATDNISETEIIASRTASSIYSAITFDCLPGEKRYTIFLKAGGTSSTCVAATGCYEGMYIAPDVCQDLNLELYSTQLNPAGKYDALDHFDFRNMIEQCAGGQTSIMTCVTGGTDIGKTICCALQEMIKLFETPGLTIMEGIRDLVGLWIGKVWVDLAYNLVGEIIADWLTDWLKNSSPDWLQDFLGIGEDMMGTITNLELVGDLMIKKRTSDSSVEGTHFWYGMHLFWKFGCDPDDPNYDTCGLIDLNLENYINDPAFPMNFLEGKFTAALTDFDKILLDRHEIKFNYGKLVLYVLNEIVIAGLTNGQAHSMLELIFLWIDCKGFAEGTLGDILDALGILGSGGSRQDLEDFCRNTLTGLFGFLESFLNALALDTTLSLTGDGRMIDDNCDLVVDRIVDGVYTGYIQGDTSQALVTGDFTDTRK